MRRALVAITLVVALVVAGVLVALGMPSPDPVGEPGPSPTRPPPVSPPSDTSPTPTPCPVGDSVELTVLTLNIHFARTRVGEPALARIAEELRAWDADVVLLQEVDRNRFRTGLVDQAQTLGRQLGMESVFGPNRPVRPGFTGNAVLSRFPVVSSRNHPLPTRPGLIPRGLLRVTIDIDGQRVSVFNTHFEHSSPAARREQARAAAAVLRRTSHPGLLGGDLNTGPDTPPLRVLGRAGLVDVWPAAGNGAGLTAPAADPRHRIDHVLTGPTLAPVSADVLISLVSDHRAVRAEVASVPSDCR